MILVEMITPLKPKINDVSSKLVLGRDMVMLTQCSGGREKSFSQFETLASDSGFLRCEIICSVNAFHVIEFHK